MKKLCLLCLLFISCENDLKEYLENKIWAIESITYENENIRDLFVGNTFSFEKEKCRVPFMHNGMEKGDQYGKWSIDKKNKINISSKNDIFNGIFEICFALDSKDKVVLLYMNSEKVSIVAHTSFQSNYDYKRLPLICEE